MKRFSKIYRPRLKEEKKKFSSGFENYRKKIEEYRNLYLRVLADFNNYRKKVKEIARKDVEKTKERILYNLLPVIDNFERALKYKDSRDYKSVIEGIEMVYRFMLQVLEGEGLKPFESVGRRFDPRFHEAVETVEKKDLPDEVIVEEYQRGYLYKGRVLRPAKVVVNKVKK